MVEISARAVLQLLCAVQVPYYSTSELTITNEFKYCCLRIPRINVCNDTCSILGLAIVAALSSYYSLVATF